MRPFLHHFLFTFLLLLCMRFAAVTIAQPAIVAVDILTEHPVQNERFELAIQIESAVENRFDYDDILLEAFFESPDGVTIRIEGFYYQHFMPNSADELQATGTPHFRIRFAPRQAGEWQFYLKLADAEGVDQTEAISFFVDPGAAKGFLRVADDKRRLRDDAGQQVFLVGENIAWTSQFPGYDPMAHYFEQLAENGANYAKLMLTPWGYHIEWGEGSLRNYSARQTDAFMIDSLFRMASQLDLYLQLAFSIHTELNFGNPAEDWTSNPYNSANGGFCNLPQEFFSNPDAKAAFKNRMRYIVARWGYSKNLAAWEIFSETDNFPFYSSQQATVSNWAIEMAAWLQQHDPNNHLVSVGYALPESEPAVWNHPAIDFTQLHLYHKSADLSGDVFRQMSMYLNKYNKPVLTGEFGIGHYSDSMAIWDSGGIALHNALWSSALTGSMGVVVPWYWEEYVDQLDLYAEFAAVAGFLDDALDEVSSPVHLQTKHAQQYDWIIEPDYFSLTEPAPSSNFQWHSSGQMIPSADSLNQFLYGPISLFAALRNPPVFSGFFSENTVLAIETGSQVNQAVMQLRIDETIVFEQSAASSEVYFIEIPAGYHQIGLDNIGAGFASVLEIEQLTLENYLPKIRAFGLEQDAGLLAWIHHRDFNWKYIYQHDQLPSAVSAELLLPLKSGTYRIDWYNTSSGLIDSVSMIESGDEGVLLSLPAVEHDLALISNFITKARSLPQFPGVVVYPNPSRKSFTFAFELSAPEPVSLEIIDLHGRMIYRHFEVVTFSGTNQLTWKIDQSSFKFDAVAKPGIYIYRLVLPQRTITGKLMLSR
ncbi:MAG: DUF5060 domain-containing protein [Bacteroidetes bacterium]|jgi:hypothetical protein|nr:DUF5060 domain-containing protein [Bacteroidota bacterium]